MRYLWLTLGILASGFLVGCASITNPDYDPPVVNLQTFRAIPQEGMVPRFEITLHVINPNRDPLILEGIFYTISIEGYKILSGVSNNLPSVEPYGDADITIYASANLISSITFFGSLLQTPRDTFSYSFNAKLDPGGFASTIAIAEEGTFSLNPGYQ